MQKLYFTIAGTCHYFGQDFFERGMNVRLVKEPDNEIDAEAIRVEMPGLGKVGYVANNVATVLGQSSSAGRLYDKLGPHATGRVLYVLSKGIVCQVIDKGAAQEGTEDKAGRPEHCLDPQTGIPFDCPNECADDDTQCLDQLRLCSDGCIEAASVSSPLDCPDGCIETKPGHKMIMVPMECPDQCDDDDTACLDMLRKCSQACIEKEVSAPMDCPDGCIE